MKLRKILALLLALLTVFMLSACSYEDTPDTPDIPDTQEITDNPDTPDVPDTPDIPDTPDVPDVPDTPDTPELLDENGSYTTKDDVALYIYQYGHLPQNFIKKKDAQAQGWSGGGFTGKLKGKSIGGDYFGNYEGLLPTKKGRSYTECDIDTMNAKSRGAKRIVFSNDGLIYYTDDHYESFTLLYGEE